MPVVIRLPVCASTRACKRAAERSGAVQNLRLAPDAETGVTLREQEVAVPTLRSARRCIRTRRFARPRVIFNKRQPNCTLSTAPLKKYGHGW